MARRFALMILIVLTALFAGCGNDDPPPAGGSGGSTSLTWTYVDGGGRQAGMNPGVGGDNPQLATFNSKLYAIYSEGTPTVNVRVAVYNSNDAAPAWNFVDGGANGLNRDWQNAPLADHGQLLAFDSRLYAAWQENGQIRVAVYNGNDAAPVWTFVDGGLAAVGINKDPAAIAENPRFAVLGTKLYAAWQERGASTLVQVAVYNGNDSAPVWTFVDNGGIVSTEVGGNARPILTAYSSKLYLAFENNGIAVKVYGGDDNAPAWTTVMGTVSTLFRVNQQAYTPEMAVYNDRLYIVWREVFDTTLYNTSQIRVAVYNGNDAAADWRFVDGFGIYGINKNPQTFAESPRLVVNGGCLYAVWAEYLPEVGIGQVRVAAYNGNDAAPAWSFKDKGEYGINYDPAHHATSPAATAFDGKLYTAWREDYYKLDIRIASGR